MAYVRKTVDEYNVMGNYGYGWETVTYADNWKDARTQAKCYRENERGIPFKIVKKRIKIEADTEK